jgi:hypothetical protein
MDAIETLRQDVREGRIAADRLVDLLASQQRLLQTTQQQLQSANDRIELLEKKLGGPPAAKLAEPFSVRSEEQRQAARGKKHQHKGKRQGRQGQLQLSPASRKHFQQEGVVPAADTALHGDAVLAGMLLQERQCQTVEPGEILANLFAANARLIFAERHV